MNFLDDEEKVVEEKVEAEKRTGKLLRTKKLNRRKKELRNSRTLRAPLNRRSFWSADPTACVLCGKLIYCYCQNDRVSPRLNTRGEVHIYNNEAIVLIGLYRLAAP